MINNLMIDIETLGNPDNGELPVICQISAKWFDKETGKTSEEEFNYYIDLDSCKLKGGTFTSSTLIWWFKQDKTSLVTMAKGLEGDNILDIWDCLKALNRFIHNHCDLNRESCCNNQFKVFACSPSFDLSILERYYHTTDISVPWRFWQKVDVRTIKYLMKEDDLKDLGPNHNAIDDVSNQIEIVKRYYKNHK